MLGLLVAFFAFGVNPALAHNAFDSSSPFDGETLASPPAQWSITFTKSVPLETFSGEIINGDGVRTQLTNAVHGSSDNIVVATLPTALSGAITARWKLVSSDGHVVSGRVAFSVNATTTTTIAVPPTTSLVVNPEVISPQASSTTASPPPTSLMPSSNSLAPTESVKSAGEFGDANPVPELIRWSLRSLGYLAILILIGLVFAEMFLAEGALAAATGRRLLLMSSAAITVVPLLQGWIFLADVNGYSFFKAPLDTFDLFSTTPGSMMLTRALTGAAISYAAIIAWPQLTNTIKERQAIGLIGVYLVTLAYTSHSRSQALPLLGIPVDVLHVAASAVWLGGLAVIALTVIPLVDPKNALLTYTRYGRYAQYAVITIVVTGVIQTLRLHGVSLASLFGERHGQILLLKIVAVGLMLKVGDINRRRLLKNLPSEESSIAKRSSLLLRASYTELVCGVLVLALTSILVTSSFT
ncbi:MAG: CopD family protein [Actinomycetota bacterium]|nr:CopD family protein [Actinomycetota bacterium]MDA3019769.1 CopD family protein [Actinomycetota bacterium]